MRIKALLLGCAFAALIPAAALAQPAGEGAGAGQDEASAVDDLVVTARKREERLQDVPISVTAVGGETLEREQVNSVKDVAAFAPGLNINTDAAGRAFISIRGIGTTLIDTVQPGVGIFIDGIYQPNTSYLNSPVLDVERIEVLRGPQGTLFGNNTLGGAINVISRAPTDDFTARVSADWASPDNYYTVAGAVSGPLVEGVLRGRIAASYHTQDGFSHNDLAGGDARPTEHRSLRGSLIWEPTDTATITLGSYYERVEGAQTAYANPTGPRDYLEDITFNVNSIAAYEYWGVNLKGVFDLESLNTEVTAIVSYDDKDGTAEGDGDFGPVDFLRVTDGRNTLATWTGEIRADTRWSDSLSTLVGVFANDSDLTNYFVQNLVLFGISSPQSFEGELTSQGVFGTVFWKINDTLELAAGLRFDHQRVTATNAVLPYSASEWQPRVTLTQHWTENWMSYASVSRGFRGGGANGPGAPNPIWRGDSVWTYELGNKFQTADRTLTVNTSIYFNDYSDYIGQNSLAPNTMGPGFVAINLNTGDVESYGAELEVLWKPTEQFTLQSGLTYNHTRVTDGSEYTAVTGIALATDRILFLPDWNAFATASYTVPIGADDLRFDVTGIYKGDRVGSTLSPTFVPELASYTLVNAAITFTHDDLSFSVWGTNLFDEEYYESYLDSSLLGATGLPAFLVNNLGITGDGRRVGVRLKYSF